MRQSKRILLFFLAGVGCYAALMAPWPGVQHAYARMFQGAGNIVFARFWFWSEGTVVFHNIDSLKPGDLPPGVGTIQADATRDTVMVLRKVRAPQVGNLRTSSRYIGYSPTAMLVALVLATPIPWRRRGVALLWGMGFVHAFIVLRVTLTLAANGFAADKGYALFSPSEFWYGMLSRAQTLLADDPSVSFVVPMMIWFLVIGRQWFLRTAAPSAGDRNPSNA